MTESNVDIEIIKRTQESLGKFVKKPPLTDKLLKKPPFKFIHDIIKVVIRDTNFLEELYSEDELNADNIKDRDGKMKFLQKLIDYVKLVTKKDLHVKSSKIVAGLEAEKTNELFQAIAFALENNLGSKSAVETIKNGNQNGINAKDKQKSIEIEVNEKNAKPIKNVPARDKTPVVKQEPKKSVTAQRSIEKKPSSKEKEKIVKEKEKSTSKSRVAVDQKEPKKVKKIQIKEKEHPKVNGESITNGSIESHSSIKSLPSQSSVEKKEATEPITTQTIQKVEETVELKFNGDVHTEIEKDDHSVKPQDELAAIIDEEAEYRRKEKTSKKLSAKHRQKSVEDLQLAADSNNMNVKSQQMEKIERFQSSFKRESVERPRTSLRPPSARPATSRPAAPRRRDKNVEIVLQPDEVMKIGDINIKMEAFTKELEDDGENLVIIEDSAIISDNFMSERLPNNNNEEKNQDDQGMLVRQILETEKNFESVLGMENKKTEIEFDESKSQTNVKQIEDLKDSIQKLVRSVNPMGKLMDFVQEDLDSMQREYAKWNDIYKQASNDLKKEQMETASAIEPLKYQLNQLDKMIRDHSQSIEQLRGYLLTNEQKIIKIFTEV